MLRTVIIAIVVYLSLGWLSNLATGWVFLDGKLLTLRSTPRGHVLIKSGLADYKGLTLYTKKGAYIRHSNYQLIASSAVPNIFNRDLTSLYDGTFFLEAVVKDSKLTTHYLKSANLPFYYLASGNPPYLTTDATKIASVAIEFDSRFGWYYMLAGRYRALVVSLILLFGVFQAIPRITPLGQKLVLAVTVIYLGAWVTAFHPGLFTADSIHQLNNGASLNFDTMHPPFMAAVGAIFFKLGVGIHWLIFFQAFLGLSGLAALYWQLTRQLRYRTSATVVLMCLTISPLFPFTPYLISFWKDAWAGIAGVWAAVALLIPLDHKRERVLSIFILIASALLFSLVRHNSVLLAPVWTAIIFVHLYRSLKLGGFRSAGYAGIVGIVLLFSQSIVVKATSATKIHASNQIYLLELLGTKLSDDESGPKTPYLTANIIDPDWRVHFDLSRNDQLYGWGAKQVVSSKVARFTEPVPELISEYWNGWLTAPLAMIMVKAKIFYLLLSNPRSPYANGITPNSLNIRFDDSLTQTRSVLFWITERVWNSSSRILSLPATSFVILLILTMSSLIATKNGTHYKSLSVSCLCLSFFLVFLAACPSSEYRYLFPGVILGNTLIFCRIVAA